LEALVLPALDRQNRTVVVEEMLELRHSLLVAAEAPRGQMAWGPLAASEVVQILSVVLVVAAMVAAPRALSTRPQQAATAVIIQVVLGTEQVERKGPAVLLEPLAVVVAAPGMPMQGY
jgi:hypothetical protein